MAQINKPDEYFNTVNYTGTGATQTISGVGHQPDFIWTKGKSAFYEHNLRDSVRGITKKIKSNDNSAEQTNTDGITATNSDGFILGADTAGAGANEVNQSGQNYVAWNWLAGGTASSNTDGSITSSVSANTTSGFSIVSWTGSGADATVGHGLNSAPTIYIVKNRTDVSDWRVGQVLTSSNNMTDGNGYYMELNDTKASSNPGSAVTWGATPTAPTSSVFTVGSNNSHNGSGDNMIAYCFHSVKGFSKMGSYTGNGNADGTFIYTGFKPAFVMVKRTDTSAHWRMFDNKREGYNVDNDALKANASDAETTTDFIDLLSNGFKLRSSDSAVNSGTVIYMAFAENPLVGTNNIPATAR